MPLFLDSLHNGEPESCPLRLGIFSVLGALFLALVPWMMVVLPTFLARCLGMLNAAGAIDADSFEPGFVGMWLAGSLALMGGVGCRLLHLACLGTTGQRSLAFGVLPIYGFGVVMFLISVPAVWHSR